jgi:hypothetical protein
LSIGDIRLTRTFCSLYNFNDLIILGCMARMRTPQGRATPIEIGKLPEIDFNHEFDIDIDTDLSRFMNKNALSVSPIMPTGFDKSISQGLFFAIIRRSVSLTQSLPPFHGIFIIHIDRLFSTNNPTSTAKHYVWHQTV